MTEEELQILLRLLEEPYQSQRHDYSPIMPFHIRRLRDKLDAMLKEAQKHELSRT